MPYISDSLIIECLAMSTECNHYSSPDPYATRTFPLECNAKAPTKAVVCVRVCVCDRQRRHNAALSERVCCLRRRDKFVEKPQPLCVRAYVWSYSECYSYVVRVCVHVCLFYWWWQQPCVDSSHVGQCGAAQHAHITEKLHTHTRTRGRSPPFHATTACRPAAASWTQRIIAPFVFHDQSYIWAKYATSTTTTTISYFARSYHPDLFGDGEHNTHSHTWTTTWVCADLFTYSHRNDIYIRTAYGSLNRVRMPADICSVFRSVVIGRRSSFVVVRRRVTECVSLLITNIIGICGRAGLNERTNERTSSQTRTCTKCEHVQNRPNSRYPLVRYVFRSIGYWYADCRLWSVDCRGSQRNVHATSRGQYREMRDVDR